MDNFFGGFGKLLPIQEKTIFLILKEKKCHYSVLHSERKNRSRCGIINRKLLK